MCEIGYVCCSCIKCFGNDFISTFKSTDVHCTCTYIHVHVCTCTCTCILGIKELSNLAEAIFSTMFHILHVKTRYNYGEKSTPVIALYCHHSVIMADFLMPEIQQPIIVMILIINSPYFIKGSC